MMEPITSLDATTAKRIRGVVFDIDDTLTRGGVIEAESFAALFRLRDAGLYRVAVTGRPLGWCEVFANTWPVDIAVGENGAGFYRRNAAGRIEEVFFHAEAERKALEARYAALKLEIERDMPMVKQVDDRGLRRVDLAFDVNEHVTLPQDQIDALTTRFVAHGFASVVSSVHAHALPTDIDKAIGVKHAVAHVFAERIDDERDAWLFIGDSANDAAAFSYFPVSAGVANVERYLSALPTPPRFVATADRGRGFAEIVDVLLERRR